MENSLDWYPKYVEFIDEMRRVPFEWGSNDCGLPWAGRFYEIRTGSKLDLEIPSYVSERGAYRAIRKMGYSDLKEAAIGILGKEPVHPSLGCLGDLALIETGGAFKYAFGIVNGERVFYRDENGIGTKDLLEAACIFKF